MPSLSHLVWFTLELSLAGSVVHARLIKTPGPVGADASPSYAPQSIGPLDQPEKTAPLQSVNPGAPRISAALQEGLAYLHGLGVPVDLSMAGRLMMKAWMQGDRFAAAGIALCHASGCYGTPDARSVQLWIERTRRIAPVKAKLLEWHWANLTAFRHPEAAHAAGAQRSLIEAAALGDPVALNERALQSISQGQNQPAAALLERARLRGSPAAAHNLGKLRQMQISSGRPAGDIPGQADYRLALKYHRGEGVPTNITQAVVHYQRAAQQGHMAAQRMLELIFSRLTLQGALDEVWIRQLAPPEGVAVPPSARVQTTAWFQKDSSLLIDWLLAQQQNAGVARSFSDVSR